MCQSEVSGLTGRFIEGDRVALAVHPRQSAQDRFVIASDNGPLSFPSLAGSLAFSDRWTWLAQVISQWNKN